MTYKIHTFLKYGSLFLFVSFVAGIAYLNTLEKLPIEPRLLEAFIVFHFVYFFCFFWPLLIDVFQKKMRAHLKTRPFPWHIAMILSEKNLIKFTFFLFAISPIVCIMIYLDMGK